MSTEAADWVGLSLENGRYHVTARLGAGGMGLVYKARYARLDTDVVIKVPHRAMLADTHAASRFRREIRALSQLSHPHIVKIIDQGEHQGLPFVVMQYLPGGALNDRMRHGPDGNLLPMPPDSVRGWLGDVADALDYIHGQGLLHRDVKPHNILLDAQGKAYVSDFGLVKAIGGDSAFQSAALTGTGHLLGTPLYFAPEISQEKAYDGRVDQYALAATVYHWLCGRPPFEGPVMVVIALHMNQPPPDPRQWLPGLPEPAAAALLRGLAKDPRQRFPNCSAFADALLTGLTGTTAVSATVPLPASVARVVCPSCDKVLRVALSAAGKKSKCPTCQTVFLVPPNLQPAADAPPRPAPPPAALTPTVPFQPARTLAVDRRRPPYGLFALLALACLGFLTLAGLVIVVLLYQPGGLATRATGSKGGPKEFTNSVGMKLVLAPAGEFLMGSPIAEADRDVDEFPHKVELTRPFYVGAHEVTQEQYEKVMGKNPSQFDASKGGAPNFPVEFVSWDDAKEFCRRLGERREEKLAGRTYDLPTEAQWEYACRAGTTTAFHFGNRLTSDLANFDGNAPYGTDQKGGRYLGRTTKVGSYDPNAWGLYDMHGNVREWCRDWFDENYYKDGARQDPTGPKDGKDRNTRVLRGGAWTSNGKLCRSAFRNRTYPTSRNDFIGFRVVLTAGTP